MTLTITLRAAQDANACVESYESVQQALKETHGSADPIPLSTILDLQGLGDTLWCLCRVPPEQADEKRRLVSLWLADVLERVKGQLKDRRSRAVIRLLRKHAASPLPQSQWDKARTAAWAATQRAVAGMDARALAVYATAYVAAAKAEAEAEAAYAAACAATWAAGAYTGAARERDTLCGAMAAAPGAEHAWQVARLRSYLTGALPGNKKEGDHDGTGKRTAYRLQDRG